LPFNEGSFSISTETKKESRSKWAIWRRVSDTGQKYDGKKEPNSKSQVLKNRQGGIKKRCQTKGRSRGGGFLPFDF